ALPIRSAPASTPRASAAPRRCAATARPPAAACPPRTALGCRSETRCSTRAPLSVDVLVAVVEVVDVLRLDRQGFAELPGDVDGTGDVLAHHGGLDGGLGVLADGEDAVVLHEDGG